MHKEHDFSTFEQVNEALYSNDINPFASDELVDNFLGINYNTECLDYSALGI